MNAKMRLRTVDAGKPFTFEVSANGSCFEHTGGSIDFPHPRLLFLEEQRSYFERQAARKNLQVGGFILKNKFGEYVDFSNYFHIINRTEKN
jgi:hypothetical protein